MQLSIRSNGLPRRRWAHQLLGVASRCSLEALGCPRIQFVPALEALHSVRSGGGRISHGRDI